MGVVIEPVEGSRPTPERTNKVSIFIYFSP
jgi:hypothetical protein